MAITAKELAKILHLSEAAISMALNNRPGVSTATRQRVLETAREYGYDFTKIRESAEPRIERGTLCFIIYKKSGAVVADTPFFSQLTEGIELGCRQLRYSLNIYYLYEDDNIEKQLQNLPFCNGILLLGTEMKPEDFTPFRKLSVPLVVLDTYYENIPLDWVLINNFQGAYQAVHYIIRKSKSQPGYLRSSYAIGNFEERADGFYKAIRANGMSPSKSQVLKLSPSIEGAYEDMKALLSAGETPARCYFADNDLIAAGAIRALKEAGFKIPQDVGIIGFDDMPMCGGLEPPLTTVNVPKQYMGQMAVSRLIQILQEKNSYPAKIAISTSLVKRKSI